jgi:DMSO reductase anchor subunit
MWRTSWLSREVLVLPAFSAITILHAWVWRHSPEAAIWTGVAGIALCAALFVCTGMIYACLRFLQEWHTPLTVFNFIVLGLASGCMLAAALSAIAWPAAAIPFGLAALALTLSGLILRASILARNARLRPKSTLQSATGLKQTRLAQKSQGMTGGSYGARAFFHGRGAETLRWVKWAFLSLGFVLPAALSVLAWASSCPTWFIAAFVLQYLGLVAERWFFFAQARHPQNLYYQTVS